MDYTFSANQPYTEAQKWWRGPWGRDESCDQLSKLIKEPDFLVIESDWELTAAQHMLDRFEDIILRWVVSRSKDQRAYEVEISTDKVGPSLFHQDPFGTLLSRGAQLRNMATQAMRSAITHARASGERFTRNWKGIDPLIEVVGSDHTSSSQQVQDEADGRCREEQYARTVSPVQGKAGTTPRGRLPRKSEGLTRSRTLEKSRGTPRLVTDGKPPKGTGQDTPWKTPPPIYKTLLLKKRLLKASSEKVQVYMKRNIMNLQQHKQKQCCNNYENGRATERSTTEKKDSSMHMPMQHIQCSL